MSTPSKIAGVGASLARFALNKPVTIGMLFLSMLLFGIVLLQKMIFFIFLNTILGKKIKWKPY